METDRRENTTRHFQAGPSAAESSTFHSEARHLSSARRFDVYIHDGSSGSKAWLVFRVRSAPEPIGAGRSASLLVYVRSMYADERSEMTKTMRQSGMVTWRSPTVSVGEKRVLKQW